MNMRLDIDVDTPSDVDTDHVDTDHIQGNLQFRISKPIRSLTKIRHNVGLRHLQSDTEDSDVRLSPISFIIDIGRSALLCIPWSSGLEIKIGKERNYSIVLDLVSQVRDVILMNVYLDLGDPGGSGFWNEGYMGKGREMGRSVYEQPGNEVDGSYHSKEGSK